MDLQAFQPWERRNSSDTVTRPGSYSKQTDLVNATNTGVLDYIGNNLDVLNDTQAEISTSDINDLFTGTLADTSNASVVGNRLDNLDDRVSTNTSSINSINSSVSTLNANVSTLSNGKLNLSGGTMSGTLYTSSNIYKSINTDMLIIGGGTNWNNGGSLTFVGKEQGGANAGACILRGHNGTNYAEIALKPDGTTSAPTPATTDNSTKIATTQYVRNSSIRRFDITDNVNTNQPWKAIASVYADMPTGICMCGHISNGGHCDYYGSKTTDKYGSFMVICYAEQGKVWNVTINNGNWYYKAVTVGSATSFTL